MLIKTIGPAALTLFLNDHKIKCSTTNYSFIKYNKSNKIIN